MATETAIDVVMPQMGVSVSEGTVTKWLKQEGEHIEADEPLLEISTDKVDTEVPSPASGTLTQILVLEGETVEVGTPLARIGGAAGAPAPAEAPPAPEPVAAEPVAARTALRSPRRLRRSGAAADGERQGVRLPGRGADRLRARRRPRRGAGHRPRRPRDEEGHPRVHRVRRTRCGCAAATGACRRRAPQLRLRRHPPLRLRRRSPPRPAAPVAAAAGAPGRDARAGDRHAPRHRRPHAPLARHLRARDERDRGRHVEDRRRARAAEEGVPGRVRRQPDVPRVRRAGHRRERCATTRT